MKTETKKKVTILGAGAMGCLYAAYLARNPAVELLLTDHNAEKVDVIGRDGLVMRENNRELHFSVKAALSGVSGEPADVLMIFVKAHQTYDALKSNAFLIGPETTVVSLQNGMGNYLEIAKFVPLDRIVVGTSNHNSTLLGPGKILHAADGKTIIGAFTADTSRVDQVKSLFAGTGLDLSSSPDVRRLIWRKLLINMAINPLTMLLEVKNGFLQADRPGWDCVVGVVREGLAVAEADGCKFDEAEILELIRMICLLTKSGCSSMYQDRMYRRQTEIDFINGTVVKLARRHRIPVPYNTLLVNLVHAVENTYAAAGRREFTFPERATRPPEA